MSADLGTYRLLIPASADRLSTARLFVAAAARQAGADERMVDDLRLAVTEACTLALRTARMPSTVEVRLLVTSEVISVTVGTAPADERSTAPPGVEDPASDGASEPSGPELLGAIASDLRIASDGDGQVSISFVVRSSPAPDPWSDAADDTAGPGRDGRGDPRPSA